MSGVCAMAYAGLHPPRIPTHDAAIAESLRVREELRSQRDVARTEHVAPMKKPPLGGECGVMRSVKYNAGADAFEDGEPRRRPTQGVQLAADNEQQHR